MGGIAEGEHQGFFNVVISLLWWYAGIRNAAQGKVYKETVDEVLWVLDWMLESRTSGKKRAPESAKEDNQRGSKRCVLQLSNMDSN
jgi:hypothetical protein